jgi:DNA repair protein RadC
MTPIKPLPTSMQPANKLISIGAHALADVELLAVLLRSGCEGVDVLTLAETLFVEFGGLAGVFHAAPEELAKIKGMGAAKVAALLSVCELSKRSIGERLREREAFHRPDAVKQYLQLQIGHLPHEVFSVIFLDSQNRLLAFEELFRGTLSQTSVYPREVVLRALKHRCAAVVLSHNHPSGSVQPSRADEALTQNLKASLALVDVRVLDHVIVGQGQALSMAEQGLM